MSVTGIFIRLGGGQPAETPAGYERTGYIVTGWGVALFALVTTGVTAVALTCAGWPAVAVPITALIAGLAVGLVGRALAGAQPTSRPDRRAGTPNIPAVAARIGTAVLAGLVVAELATTVLFDGTVDRVLDERAAAAAATTPAVSTAQADLDRVVAERTALDSSIDRAAADIDNALVIARCEFNPTPTCPQTKITGVPGRGPEARAADNMLDDARTALAAAQSRIAPLDQKVENARTALDDARSAAATAGDRGLGARWAAAHAHTTGETGALLSRLLVWTVFVFLAALPLVLRWWRGETTQERRRAAEAVRDRAERAADAAIAEKQARVRAETAAVEADRQLTAARLAAEADTTIDREQQRTRVIAALGGLEIGVTDRRSGPEARPSLWLASLPATAEPHPDRDCDLPVPVGKELVTRQSAGVELPLIGTVPFTDTAARLISPLVPEFVSSAIEGAINTASRPLQTARHILSEAEEITFTLRRTRQIAVESPAVITPIRRARTLREAGADTEVTLGADAIVSATTHLEPATDTAPTPPEASRRRELPPGSRVPPTGPDHPPTATDRTG